MSKNDTLNQRIFQVTTADEFEALALEVFYCQFNNIPIYRAYCQTLNRVSPQTIYEIPFLPIEFFKTHRIISPKENEECCFLSSGTTGVIRSKHYVSDLSLYRRSFTSCFKQFFGDPENSVILGLLPNYFQQGNSSLVYMVDELIKQSKHELSGFYLDDIESLLQAINIARQQGIPVFLFGVSYALLDLADRRVDLTGVRVIETGGMKGRRKEMIKEELHAQLSEGFSIPVISSEYGMTELLSQAYSFENTIFQTPPWMKVLIRDTEDPFRWEEEGKTGGISIIDLANINSCSFIHTQDLGKMTANGFQIIGRFDNSDIRGCNLLVNN
jgi:phenylacetate-coenzyme A ligase PaaK-like adenylate-forming protein